MYWEERSTWTCLRCGYQENAPAVHFNHRCPRCFAIMIKKEPNVPKKEGKEA